MIRIHADASQVEKLTASSKKVPGFAWPVYDDSGNNALNMEQFEETDASDTTLQNRAGFNGTETDIDNALKLVGVRVTTT